MALPPQIANFDYKSFFFGPDYVHNVVVGLTVTAMSSLAYVVVRLATPYLAGFFRGVAFILALSVFLFLGLIALRIGGPGPAPAIILPAINPPLSSWPVPLTKNEIADWGKTLSVYHPTTVILTLINDQQLPFMLGFSQALRQAKWPSPSIQPNNYVVGVYITVGKNADNIGQAVRQLMEKKFGITVDYDISTSNAIPDNAIEIRVGWPPP